MARTVTLTALKGGIDRRKVKGGADPGSLYDLLNGYVDASGTPVARPGTRQAYALPTGTKGLCAFDGGLVVFSHQAKTTPSGVTCEQVIHPTDATQAISDIHFVAPLLRILYVVAEFANGDVRHYWLEAQSPWSASTHVHEGTLIEPTVRNGYAYRAHRLGAPPPLWAPDVARDVGDVVEPTVPNGFEYTVTAVIGASPKSGLVEPSWPTEDGGVVHEDVDLTPGEAGSTATPTTSISASTQLPPAVVERYGNLAGSKPSGGVLP